jgi:tRNA pseudouridine32 synthase / 23S rRNA pseudouridine746 synthase
VLKILLQDAQVVVVDKPAGFLAVPGRGAEKQECVASRVKVRFPHCIDQPAVHRLDMDTSGLMALALTTEAHRELSRQFAERLVQKKYVALVEGVVTEEAGTIELAFRLDPDNRPRQVYDPVQGKVGISRWRKLGVEGGRTRIGFEPLTGRTHQLRLHAAHPLGLGCPIVGDRLYGKRKEKERMLLHASFLRFRHPATGEEMCFRSEPPF